MICKVKRSKELTRKMSHEIKGINYKRRDLTSRLPWLIGYLVSLFWYYHFVSQFVKEL